MPKGGYSNLNVRILKELGLSKEGLTISELNKITNHSEPSIRFWIDYFLKEKIIRRNDVKYQLIKTTFIHNGKTVIDMGNGLFLFLNCPYYPCGMTCGIRCKYFQELPPHIMKYVENKLFT